MTNFEQAPYGQGQPTILDTHATYSYEKATSVSIRRVYGEMAIGLAVTAFTALFTDSTKLLYSFLAATGRFGWILLVLAQLGLAIFLGVRALKMSVTAARITFYAYAALTGVIISTIFSVFSITSIAVVFAMTAGFFACLTMLALTTKVNMLKAGPILFVGLIVLVISQFIIGFFMPGQGTLQLIAAIGLLLFAGLTAYDAQKTRAFFEQYAAQPEMIRRLSIVCALNLYLDFINMFLYLLELIGSRRD